MAIYQLDGDELAPLELTTFAREGILERSRLQRILRGHVDVISPGTLVIGEEFGEWEGSRRRIDLLGVDKEANLIVIELKRSEDGEHMELQALRYAAMVSTLTFDRAVEIYGGYLQSIGKDEEPQELLLEFLGWDEPDEDAFAQDVRIVLASADFSREVTTSVLWLNEHGLDIRCVRLRPYQDRARVLIDVQQVIPLPEAEEYQVRIRAKVRAERAARSQSRDFTKYDITLGDITLERLPKRRAIFHVIKYLCGAGVNPEAIRALIPWRLNAMRCVDGTLNSQEFENALAAQLVADGRKPQTKRFFIDDDELIHANSRTYAVTKMWGVRTGEALEAIDQAYSNRGVSISINPE